MSTILCVEDEPQIRADLAEELADAGYEVLEASNGAEGIRMIVERKPDLVISDISMPGMSGYELLTELRRDHPGLAEMPFLFLSAFNERETVIEGIRLGADDFLTKPIGDGGLNLPRELASALTLGLLLLTLFVSMRMASSRSPSER